MRSCRRTKSGDSLRWFMLAVRGAAATGRSGRRQHDAGRVSARAGGAQPSPEPRLRARRATGDHPGTWPRGRPAVDGKRFQHASSAAGVLGTPQTREMECRPGSDVCGIAAREVAGEDEPASRSLRVATGEAGSCCPRTIGNHPRSECKPGNEVFGVRNDRGCRGRRWPKADSSGCQSEDFEVGSVRIDHRPESTSPCLPSLQPALRLRE